MAFPAFVHLALLLLVVLVQSFNCKQNGNFAAVEFSSLSTYSSDTRRCMHQLGPAALRTRCRNRLNSENYRGVRNVPLLCCEFITSLQSKYVGECVIHSVDLLHTVSRKCAFCVYEKFCQNDGESAFNTVDMIVHTPLSWPKGPRGLDCQSFG